MKPINSGLLTRSKGTVAIVEHPQFAGSESPKIMMPKASKKKTSQPAMHRAGGGGTAFRHQMKARYGEKALSHGANGTQSKIMSATQQAGLLSPPDVGFVFSGGGQIISPGGERSPPAGQTQNHAFANRLRQNHEPEQPTIVGSGGISADTTSVQEKFHQQCREIIEKLNEQVVHLNNGKDASRKRLDADSHGNKQSSPYLTANSKANSRRELKDRTTTEEIADFTENQLGGLQDPGSSCMTFKLH